MYQDIIKAVSSIIFLSTPHRGTNLAETLNRILQVSFVSNPMQFIAELASGSQTLQKLNEQFRHIAPKLQIVSLYETRPTPVLRKSQIMVLEKDSSVLGYPGEISKPLDADHHGVCKYESPEDPRYITVRNILKSLVGKAKPRAATEEMGPASRLNLAESFSIADSPENDYNFFHDRWASGTCSWILQNDAFIGWVDDTFQKPRVLWIHGTAASGKSVLSSFVIDHLSQLGSPCQYFFIRFTNQKKRALNVLLRSLAYQLASSIPAYADKLRELDSAITDLKTTDYRTVWQWLFKQGLFQLDLETPIFWVIDGVDEADSPGSVIRLLSDLHQTTIPLRVLIVSRKTHEISSAFQRLGRQVHMEAIRTEGNAQDFRSYIDHEMDLASEESYREEVTAQLLDRARGNFLWLHLAVQKINNCYTKVDVENALKELPAGMEALYDRMALLVQSEANAGARRLGQSILAWVTCSQRILTVEELSDALDNHGVLEIQRTIADLCGGFVVLDHEGKVAMIHETAREYLIKGANSDRPLLIDRKAANDLLLKRCIMRLTDPSLRGQVNRNQPPALLDYATTTWFIHLYQGNLASPEVLEIVMKFLQGPHVLTWINIVARKKDLRALVVASRYLTDVVLKLRRMDDDGSLAHHQAIGILEDWATDLIKVVGKFGNNLRQSPDSIYKLIPPFCPVDSILYQQFGLKEARALHVSGFTTSTWDDCLARLSLESGAMASAVLAAGSRIAVLTNTRNTSHILIYNCATFEEQRRLSHPERVLSIQANTLGDLLVSYGYKTTRVWDISTGDCLKIIQNPPKRPRPHTLHFDDKNGIIMVGSEDRRVRTNVLDEDSAVWETREQIEEQSLEDTTLNFPICSALSPDGNMIAFGYRSYPTTVWELEPAMLLGQCNMSLDETNMTIENTTWGEVFQIAWHPYSGEVFGLTQVGVLFRWDPYEDEPNATVEAGADKFTVSRDGSLIATGDGVGTLKVYANADFSLLYQLSSQDPVLYLSFSADSRRIYDIRGTYGNVWEPNTLIRLADSTEYPDHNSDAYSETESLARFSLQPEHHSARVDNIITLAGQSIGSLYCYGTEDGVAILCEVGTGKVCDLERLSSYMPIERVAWSEDGRLVAITDLSGRLSVKSVAKAGENRETWEVHHEFDVVIPSDKGSVNQLIFHPTGYDLFAATPTTLLSVNLESKILTESSLPPGMSKAKWICHPTLADYLLAFGNTNLRVFSWVDLKEVEQHIYFPLRLSRPVTVSAAHGRSGSFHRDSETLGRLICNVDSSHVLLEISGPSKTGQTESQYLLFDIAEMKLGSPANDEEETKTVNYTRIPTEIASRIREPLAFLSRRRLAFLDVDRWICTWRLPTPTMTARPQRGRIQSGTAGSQNANPGVEQYYFLPGDWVTADEVHLCAVMPDGTLLCPRNGDVATVQCAKLRK